MTTGARSVHWKAPLALIAAFAAIDACNGLEKGDSPPPVETGHPGDAGDGGGPPGYGAQADAANDHTLETDASGQAPPDAAAPDAFGSDAAARDAGGPDAVAPDGYPPEAAAHDSAAGGPVGTGDGATAICFGGDHGTPGCGFFPTNSGATTCCSGTCVDTTNDPANCGACGNACTTGTPCVGGACGCNTTCGSSCVNVQSDANNCGGCGNVCPAFAACVAGACACTLPGQSMCNGACVSLADNGANCGSCGHACPSGCSASICLATPQTLASGQGGPNGIAVDATSVYWTNWTAGTVMKAPLNGGAATTLATVNAAAVWIAVTATTVFFTTSDTATGVGSVMSVPITGGTPLPLAVGLLGVQDLAVDAANVYVAGNGAIVQIPMAGGNARVLAKGYAAGLAVDATSVYWADNGDNTIRSAPLSGGIPLPSLLDGGSLGLPEAGALVPLGPLEIQQTNPTDVAVDSTSVYWAATGTVRGWPLMGGTADGGVNILSNNESSVTRLDIDDSHAYWLGTFGDIRKAPLAGGMPTTVALGAGQPTDLAVDATSVYWTEAAAGTVMKAPK